MDFLKELYLGNVRPYEHVYAKQSEEYKKALDRYLQCMQAFDAQLSEAQKELFEKLGNVSAGYTLQNGIETFKLGFRLGVQMMSDCFCGGRVERKHLYEEEL